MELSLNTLITGKVLHIMESLDSTNAHARLLVSNSKPIEGTAIIALTQVAGRGQIGNKWYAEAGQNVTCSIIYRPTFLAASRNFDLNICVALGISDYLQQQTGIRSQVKWPNDILVEGRKIAGILIETLIFGSQINYAIIGIGLNVNTSSFPDDLPNATSLRIECHRSFSLEEVYEDLLLCVEKRYLQLRNSGAEKLRSDYLERLYGLNETLPFQSEEHTFDGRITGIDDQGRLIVQGPDRLKAYAFKEIRFL